MTPRHDLTVLDLTAHRAGPTARAPARRLGRQGHQDRAARLGRRATCVGGNRHGFDFQNLHRNKRAMTLNLKSAEGRDDLLQTRAKSADVVVENYRSDVKHRLGIDYEAVAKINPRIVYGSISGFGQTGPTRRGPVSTRSRKVWAG